MFTDEELEGAILKFLQSEVSVDRSDKGVRDILKTKEQVYELVGGVFLLRPRAFFSVCWMASNALRAEVAEQLVDLQVLLDAAPRVSDVSQPVESTAELYNAEAAMLSLTAAFSAREGGVRGAISPSVQRFTASVDRFMRSELLKNTVVQGVVVKTGEQLQEDIASTWVRMRARQEQLMVAVSRLKNALNEFESVRLPDVVVGGILKRVQARLAEITAIMESDAAAANSREALLELSAMRVLLQQASSFKTPVLHKAPLTSDAASGTFTSGAGTSASIMGSVSGPFYYGPGTALSYSVGGAVEQVTLPRHSAASLQSQAKKPWVVPTAGLSCVLRVNGGAAQTVTTAAWSSGQVAATALKKGLTGVDAVWNSETGVLELRTTSSALGASLTLGLSTEAERGFVQWFGSLAAATGRGVPAAEVVAAFASSVRVTARVVEERIELRAREGGPELVVTAGAGATALGLATTPAAGAVTTFTAPVPFAARGVVPGDQLVFEGDTTRYAVVDVAGTVLTFAPARPLAGATPYRVWDGMVASYLSVRAHLDGLEQQAGWDLAAVDQAVGRLARGARYTRPLQLVLVGYQAALYELLTLCDGYQVEREPTVEEIVRVLTEHGFDRARDLFVSLQLSTFFSLPADGVSYRTWVMRSAAEAARVAAPVSKTTGDPTATWKTIAVFPTQYKPTRR